MDWIPVEEKCAPLALHLVCGLDEWGVASIDLGYWDDKWHLSGGPGFTPQFYTVIEWPPELVVDGEGL